MANFITSGGGVVNAINNSRVAAPNFHNARVPVDNQPKVFDARSQQGGPVATPPIIVGSPTPTPPPLGGGVNGGATPPIFDPGQIVPIDRGGAGHSPTQPPAALSTMMQNRSSPWDNRPMLNDRMAAVMANRIPVGLLGSALGNYRQAVYDWRSQRPTADQAALQNWQEQRPTAQDYFSQLWTNPNNGAG